MRNATNGRRRSRAKTASAVIRSNYTITIRYRDKLREVSILIMRHQEPNLNARIGIGWVCTLLATTFVTAAASAADLRLGSVFSDGMVLQRGQPAIVWGTADANVTVDVALGDKHQTARSDADGKWRVSLPAPEVGQEELALQASSAGQTASVHHIAVGDVWICAGQSNMQMTLRETEGGPELIRNAAKFKRIRLLTIPKRFTSKPQTNFNAKWQTCSPESAANFPAVGFYFGAELLKSPSVADVPIGLIDCSFGGTSAEAWMSKQALSSFAKSDLLPSLFGGPGQMFNAMVAPLAPFQAKGVLWYQGESNAGRPDIYAHVLSTMIADWRTQWDEPALPFLIVQLPPFVDSHFTWIREAQADVAQTVPNTALAVTIDTTDGYNLHPKEKREIGRRLALLARHMVYKEGVLASGPVFKQAAIEGSDVRVTFDTGGNGLAVQGAPRSRQVKGFALAGTDGEYRYAHATIDGDDVLIHCDSVPSPKTVRYAWDGIPDAHLTNKSGLPAAPFRTYDLPRSMVEIRKQPAPHRVVMPAYDIEIDGDGNVTSLAVGGRQFLSNEPGPAVGNEHPR